MKIPKTMCRVLPPLIARKPYLLEVVLKRGGNFVSTNIALKYQNIQRAIYNRIAEDFDEYEDL